MDDFALWLTDLVRSGLASVRQQPWSWWDRTAARLVDAQLPGLAEQVRAMASEVDRRQDWLDHLLVAVGRWWALTRTWAHREALDNDQLGDLRAVLGWPYATAYIKAGDAVIDHWVVLGVRTTEDGRLQSRRTWMWGETTHELVQVLDFAAGVPLPVPAVVGAVLDAELSRYPGHFPRRGLFRGDPVVVGTRAALPQPHPIADAFTRASAVLAENPWSIRVPATVSGAGMEVLDGSARLTDADGDLVVLDSDAAAWPVLARTGGTPVDLFGELEDGRFRPLSAVLPGSQGEELVGL